MRDASVNGNRAGGDRAAVELGEKQVQPLGGRGHPRRVVHELAVAEFTPSVHRRLRVDVDVAGAHAPNRHACPPLLPLPPFLPHVTCPHYVPHLTYLPYPTDPTHLPYLPNRPVHHAREFDRQIAARGH